MKAALTFSWLGAVARSLGTLALVASIGGGSPAHAQVIRPAATAEKFLTSGNAKQAQNTGCGQSSDGSKVLQVMTWDGNKPSFGWSFTGNTPGFQPLDATARGMQVYDPDIVSYYDASSGTYFMVAVYLYVPASGASQIYYEQQKYSPSGNAWGVVTPPTQISTGTRFDCTNPNIDVDRISGDAVMVFQQGPSLYAQALKVPSASLATNLDVVATNSPTQNHSQPDVAIYEDPSGSLPIIVSVTYITQTNPPSGGSTVEVDLTQDDLNNVQSGTGFPTPMITFAPVPSTQILESPRIAAPMFQPGFVSRFDCMTVVRYNNGSGDRIMSLTIQGGAPVPVQLVNVLTSPYKGNTRPVVTYIGDGALVAWQYDATLNIPNTGLDVLGVWVNLNGAPNDSFAGDLLRANKQTKGNQFIPSLEARGGAANPGSNGLAMWFDELQADIAYKPISWFSSQLRPAASTGTPVAQAPGVEKQFSVYPNPAAPGAHVAVPLGRGETAQSLQVLEPRTGLVVATLPLAGLQTGANDVALPSLPAGLYVLRLQTDQGPRLTRFSYQP